MNGSNNEKAVVITIDGPSGAGKGTIARLLSSKLGFALLDSGALYRLTGLACVKRAKDVNDEKLATEVAHSMDIEFVADDDEIKTYLDGEDVSSDIRSEEAGKNASIVAAHQDVRSALLQKQRDFLVPPGLVADGRDMGTVVFPDADLKIFLTASARERARRRCEQLSKAGLSADFHGILKLIEERDARDSSRATAPLKPAEDAEFLDCTELSIAQVLSRIESLISERVSLCKNLEN